MNDQYRSLDKKIEKERYGSRAKVFLDNKNQKNVKVGSESIELYFSTPYKYYEKIIQDKVKPCYKVLEIGSGFGRHTKSLLQTGAEVVASDISGNSLKVLKMTYKDFFKNKLSIKIADIESLPFDDKTFDVVACAGSLSYGQADRVDSEIQRVIKDGGIFLCIDSLNDNIIYRFNRFLQFFMGSRTQMTIKNMPNMKRLNLIKDFYNEVDVKYYGSISYLMPMLSLFFGDSNAKKYSDRFDRLINVKYSAFKFVMIAEK